MSIRHRVVLTLATLTLLLGTMVGGVGGAEAPNQKFRLYGTAADVVDPQNPDNEAVLFDTTSGEPVLMFRTMNELVVELDNQLEFKYYMQNRNCGAGSPRITLGVDDDEKDKTADFFLHGHVQPDFACPNQNTWVYQDLTDNAPRWETTGPAPTPLPAFANPWDTVETAFGGMTVVFGLLVEDSQVFKADNRGHAYYDLVTIGNHTYTDHSDAARCENTSCLPPEAMP